MQSDAPIGATRPGKFLVLQNRARHEGSVVVVLFAVRREHRGRGLTSVLTPGSHRIRPVTGWNVVEVYPSNSDEPRADAAVYAGRRLDIHSLGVRCGATHLVTQTHDAEDDLTAPGPVRISITCAGR